MRELKFRVYDKVNERYCTGIGIQNIFSSITRNNGEPSEIVLNSALLSQYDIEQSTGLKDKNGISIYEGDLVRNCAKCHVDSEEVDAVKVTDDAYLLPFRSSFGSWSPELCEVIGNIHENPELLGDEE